MLRMDKIDNSTSITTKFLLDDIKIDTVQNTIIRNEHLQNVEPRLIRVLVKLSESNGEIVTRSELLKELSGASVIGDESLTQAISKIRHYLGDTPSKPKFIKTIPKKGYMLLVPAVVNNLESDKIVGSTKHSLELTFSFDQLFKSAHTKLIAIAIVIAVVLIVLGVRSTLDSEQVNFIEKGEIEFIEKVD